MRAKTRLLCLILSFSAVSLQATVLFWSGDGVTQGGAGTWDTTNARWGTDTAGPFTTVWDNTVNNDATVDNGTGAGGSIVIANMITNQGTLTLNGSCGTCAAYSINGTGTTIFTPGSAISVPSGVNRSFNSRYAGTVTKTGAGTVTFNNSAGNVTKFILKQGTGNYAAPSRFGSGPDAADFLTFDGGIMLMNTTTAWTMGRSITVTANSGTISKSSATITCTLDKAIHGTAGGKLSLVTGIYILSNTGNDWNGPLEIQGSTSVQCGAAGVIPSTCVLSLIAAGANPQLNGFDQTVKSISGTGGTVACGGNTLTINNPAGESYTSVFTATSAGKVIKNGTGTLTLSGNSTGFGGEFIVNDGTIGYGSSGSLGANATAGLITINGGKLSNIGTGGRSVVATVLVNLAGDFTVDDSLFGPNPGQILFNGTNTIKTGNRTLTVNGAANLGLGPVSEDVAGRSITKAGSGILAFTGTNAYTGGFTFNAGQVNLNGVTLNPFGAAGTLALNGGAINVTADRGTTTYNIVNPATLAGDVTLQATTATGTRNLTFGSVWTTTSGSLTISNASVAVGPATFDVRFTNAFNFTRPIVFGTAAAANTVNLDVWNRADLGDQTYSGLISGAGTIKRSATTANTGGKVTFTQQNTYSGPTILNDGEIALGSDGTGPADAPTAGPVGTGFLSVSNDAGKLSADGVSRNLKNHIVFSPGGQHLTLMGANDLELSGNVDLAGQNIAFTNNNSGLGKISGVVSNGSLVKYGAGTLTLTAANLYTNTTVSQGTLALIGSGSLGNAVDATNTVATGATIDATGRTDGTLAIGPGQTLAGGGTVLGIVPVSGTIAPGASPGMLTTGPETWNAGAHYAWQVSNATNAAGADPGWDVVSIVGGLNLAASSSNKVTVDISSVSPPFSTNGPADGFDSSSNYVWTIATTTAGVTNFSASSFALNYSGFSNSLGAGTFTIALANAGKDIQLLFGTNNPPLVTAPGNVTMNENAVSNVTATATDPDSPTVLTFSLVSSPTFASINSTSGVVTLSPGSGTAGVYTVNVVATDDAATPLSGTNSFTVTVVGAASNPPYNISTISVSGTTVNLTWESVSGTKYQVKGSTDLTEPLASWTNVGGVVTAGGATASQTDVLGPTQTFYRVQVVP